MSDLDIYFPRPSQQPAAASHPLDAGSVPGFVDDALAQLAPSDFSPQPERDVVRRAAGEMAALMGLQYDALGALMRSTFRGAARRALSDLGAHMFYAACDAEGADTRAAQYRQLMTSPYRLVTRLVLRAERIKRDAEKASTSQKQEDADPFAGMRHLTGEARHTE